MKQIEEACSRLGLPVPDHYLQVDTDVQKLTYHSGNKTNSLFAVSTSRFGAGSGEGSFKTPLGLHRIVQKIGKNEPPWTIFKSRKPTGRVWKPGMQEENQILTRILRLEGLEPGINSGPGIDSFKRYIYIHGTNREDKIGTPNSHGCVCMKNDDILTLFDLVEEGTLVHIS